MAFSLYSDRGGSDFDKRANPVERLLRLEAQGLFSPHPKERYTGAMNNQSDENGSLLAAVLQTAIDAIVTIDSQGIIQNTNHAIEKLFGYSAEEVVGRNISMLMPEPDRSRHDGYLSRYMQTKKPAIIGIGREVLGRRKDGSLIPLDLAISEIEVGGRTLFTGIMRDMTQRNRTESALRLAQQRMIQSERLAAIGQMIAGLAHESRNALQRSRACLDMLEMDLNDQAEQLDLVQRTRAALLELQTLYEEVRSYASPIVLDRTPKQLNLVCFEAWQNLGEEFQAKAVQLQMHGGDSAACLIDHYRIGQVFRNIFENAIFVSQRGASIHVSFESVEMVEPPIIRIRVSDEGPGLDPVQRERIFEPFYTTKSKGTGLGMAICKRIIEAHGGRIYLGSPPSGAEIVIELPSQ